jgi:hypothetical protein
LHLILKMSSELWSEIFWKHVIPAQVVLTRCEFSPKFSWIYIIYNSILYLYLLRLSVALLLKKYYIIFFYTCCIFFFLKWNPKWKDKWTWQVLVCMYLLLLTGSWVLKLLYIHCDLYWFICNTGSYFYFLNFRQVYL